MKSKYMSIPQFSKKYGIKTDKLRRLAMKEDINWITIDSNGRYQINTCCKGARELVRQYKGQGE